MTETVNDNQDEKGFEPEEQPGRKVRIQQQRRLTWREEGGVGAILSPSTSEFWETATGIRISQNLKAIIFDERMSKK